MLLLCEPTTVLASFFVKGSLATKAFFVIGSGSILCEDPARGELGDRYYVIERDAWAETIVLKEENLGVLLELLKMGFAPRSLCREIKRLICGVQSGGKGVEEMAEEA